MPTSDGKVIIDVLLFSAAVGVAVTRGAHVLPYPYGYDEAADHAEAHDAILARPRDAGGGKSAQEREHA